MFIHSRWEDGEEREREAAASFPFLDRSVENFPIDDHDQQLDTYLVVTSELRSKILTLIL